jgi:uncharacterized membrane protein (DUF106 family)
MLPLAAILDVGMKVLDKVIPDPAEKAKAQVALMEMQQKGELAQLEADLKEQEELSKRHAADMASDSWLSKNIRPMALIAVFAAYFLFAMMSAYGNNANEVYVTLLGQWGMLIFSFYFGSRGAEKIAEIWSKKK